MGNRVSNYLEKQYNTWFVVLYIPKDVQRYFGKTRFSHTLETDSRSEADIRKLDYIKNWKQRIKLARKEIAEGGLDVGDRVEHYKAELEDWKSDGLGDEYLSELHFALSDEIREPYNGPKGYAYRIRPDLGQTEIDAVREIYSRVSGALTPTKGYVEQWLPTEEYQPKTADEARKSLRLFTSRFPFFEKITQGEMKEWVSELLEARSPRTIKKRIGHVRAYWDYCFEKGYTKARNIETLDGKVLFPKLKKTKARITKTINSKRVYFTVEDYHCLLDAIPENDQLLRNLVRLGAHTGCRIEELCSMPLTKVKSDRFVVVDAKTESGWREIPIHKDLIQLVEQLVQQSTDEFLLSGLSSNNKYNKRSPAIGHRFSRLKTKLGYDGRYVFHSFRRTLIQQMLEGDVPEQHTALIVGHDLDTMSYGLYGSDISFKKKQQIMNLVSY